LLCKDGRSLRPLTVRRDAVAKRRGLSAAQACLTLLGSPPFTEERTQDERGPERQCLRAWARAGPKAVSLNARLALVAVASIAPSAVVAYASAVNPDATPAGLAGAVARAAYVLAPAAVGIHAWRRHPEERLGRLLSVSQRCPRSGR
jgi:hypothetical protein